MKTDVIDAPENPGTYDFEIGQWYRRGGLHDTYKGNRQKGISSPKDHPIIFVFTGKPGERFGYEDEFLDDDRLRYTGVGMEGDQKMAGMNAKLKNHKESGDAVHVFEEVQENPASIVSYVGEYEVDRIQEVELEDRNGEFRDAFHFILRPVGGTTVEEIDDSSLESLFESAKASASGTTGGSSTRATTVTQRTRSEPVKRFALRHADGVCQGCGEDAPFKKPNGGPFLEVHHLYRLSDKGLDDPENVIALCPNCHRRRHEGKGGDEFNEQLIEIAEERNQNFGE